MPAEYFLGRAQFFGREFEVNKNVLIPRYDTEVLVIETQKRIKKGDKVLELCTGSGCVAVTLAIYGADVTATDISGPALEVATRNAVKHNVSIDFFQSDMFEKVQGKFGVIVCNPPYIKTSEIGLADPSILHEPRIALDGGADGLEFYRIIAEKAHGYLLENGFLVLEIGFDQAEDVTNILVNCGWQSIKVINDQNGRNRVITCAKSRE